MIVYSIYDRKAQLYSVPHCAQNDGVAIRNFNYVMQSNPNQDMSMDCELYQIGTYDQKRGIIKPLRLPKFIISYGGVKESDEDEK